MPERKRIAAIITEYRVAAHADVIVGKFIKGFPTDAGLLEPGVDIVSMYLDQIPESDIGLAVSEKHDIPVYGSIPLALCQGGDDLAVDGVLAIGEHGSYAFNEKGQHLYPRRHFFEQICGVIASSGRPIPVFNDKHLSYSWRDARWMYDRAVQLSIPLMAGSSVPMFWRDPWLEHELEAPVEEAIVLGIKGMDAFGFHAMEALQVMVERRRGGERGIAAVQVLEGDAVWEAGDEGRWSRELAEAALEPVHKGRAGSMEEGCEEPVVLLLEYNDGFRAAMLLLKGYISEYGYAARVAGRVQATAMNTCGSPHPSFSYQCLNIQEMFLTGKPQYPAQRTLLAGGAIDAAMESMYRGNVRLETPYLDVAYPAPEPAPMRPTDPRPHGTSTVPFASDV